MMRKEISESIETIIDNGNLAYVSKFFPDVVFGNKKTIFKLAYECEEFIKFKIVELVNKKELDEKRPIKIKIKKRICTQCGNPFETLDNDEDICSNECYKIYFKKEYEVLTNLKNSFYKKVNTKIGSSFLETLR